MTFGGVRSSIDCRLRSLSISESDARKGAGARRCVKIETHKVRLSKLNAKRSFHLVQSLE